MTVDVAQARKRVIEEWTKQCRMDSAAQLLRKLGRDEKAQHLEEYADANRALVEGLDLALYRIEYGDERFD